MSKNMHIPLLLLLIRVWIVISGNIRPYGRTPILLSNNNIGMASSYTFSFTLDTTTAAGKRAFLVNLMKNSEQAIYL